MFEGKAKVFTVFYPLHFFILIFVHLKLLRVEALRL
jgi:hypothetical protein